MRPTIEDVPPFYRPYLAKVQGDNIEAVLTQSKHDTLSVIENIDEAKANFAYADGKWTIKSLIQHIVDSEAVFSFRGLWIARNADGPLQGFEQDDWVAEEIKNEKTFKSVLQSYSATRDWSTSLFSTMNEEELLRTGNANGFEIKALILPYLIAGHNLHHLDVLKSRYL
jgi:hypothetical protein